jgi:hypothetical protein
VDQLLELQESLLADLEEKVGVLPVYDNDGVVIANLKAVELVFPESQGVNISSLDVPFSVKYEVTYTRIKPVDPPPVTYVGTGITTTLGET